MKGFLKKLFRYLFFSVSQPFIRSLFITPLCNLSLGILRWFPVLKQRTYWVSPIEAAVEALRNANRSLKSTILEVREANTQLQPLTMKLTGKFSDKYSTT